MSNTPKIVFDSKYSTFGIFTLICLPACSAILFCVLVAHFQDRPILTSVLALFCLLIILAANTEKIVVEQDRFTIITRRLIPALTTRKIFLFSRIGSLEASLPLTQGKDIDDGIYNFGKDPIFQKPTKSNTLIVRYKDGVEVELTPSIYRPSFHTALDHIHRLSGIPFVIKD